MIENPHVSIIIPVYNGSNYMRDAIDSALNQTYDKIEIIVINDGSNDNGATREIAQSYGKKICYYEKENSGVASALNMGIDMMKGEYFSWLSHDDIYFPDKIERQINFLKSNPVESILFSDYCYINSEGEFLRNYKSRKTDPNYFYYNMIVEGVHGCTLLIPKKCFETEGKFDESLLTTQDHDLWFKFGAEYEFKYVEGCIVKSRIHDEQDSKKKRDICKIEQNNLYLKYIQILIDSDYPSQFYLEIAQRFNLIELYSLKNKMLFIYKKSILKQKGFKSYIIASLFVIYFFYIKFIFKLMMSKIFYILRLIKRTVIK